MNKERNTATADIRKLLPLSHLESDDEVLTTSWVWILLASEFLSGGDAAGTFDQEHRPPYRLGYSPGSFIPSSFREGFF